MSKSVILAEKPSQGRAYASAYEIDKKHEGYIEIKPCSTFPNGAFITWGIGHLLELKEPHEYDPELKKWSLDTLPFIPEKFEYRIKDKVKDQFKIVKKLFQEADFLINGCDIDIEGSNIFYSILQMTGVKGKPIKRLWINSLEVDEVRAGFKNLLDNERDYKMFLAASARQQSDFVIGINLTRLYSILIGQKGIKSDRPFSVGRVQLPTVYMIYEREMAIRNFVPKSFHEIIATFESSNGFYEGKASNFKVDTVDELNSFMRSHDLKLNESLQGVIKSVETNEKRIKSPRLHSLSTLQSTANKKWKYSPAQVLEIAQTLYEKKLITYPRTMSNYITENEFDYLVKVVEDYKKLINVHFETDTQPKKRYVDNKKVQEHYSITLTKNVPGTDILNTLSPKERNIYEEILRTTLAMFHSDYVYEETKIITIVNNVDFETTGKVEVSKGWKELFSQEKEDEEDISKDEEKTLPSVSVDEIVSTILESKEGIKTAPKRLNEGSIINLMKSCGKYVEDEEDSYILRDIEGIGTEATRANIIESIKENGYIEVKKNLVYITSKAEIICEALKGTLLTSPSMTAKWEAYLKKIIEGKGTPDNFLSNIEKFVHHIISEAPKNLESDILNKYIETEKEKAKIGICPCCKKGELLDRKTFIGCSEYKNGCKFSIPREKGKKKLTDKNVKDLIEKGKTAKIKGFVSAKGSKFDAALIIDTTNNQIAYDFSK